MHTLTNIGVDCGIPFIKETIDDIHVCFKCKSVPTVPKQTDCGEIVCRDCVNMCCDNVRCPAFDDTRILRDISWLGMTCLFEEKGCLWIGSVSSFRNHIMNDCDFPERECDVCAENVVCKNMVKHKKNVSCKKKRMNRLNTVSKEIVKVSHAVLDCPLNCGSRIQQWLMTSHVFNDCSNAPLKCPLGNDCRYPCSKREKDEHVLRCIVKQSSQVLNVLNNTFHETITRTCRWRHKRGKTCYSYSFQFLIQNTVPMILRLTCSDSSEFLRVGIVKHFDVNEEKTYKRFLDELEVTVKIVNISKKKTHMYEDILDRSTIELHQYAFPLKRCSSMSSSILFDDPEYILRKNLLRNPKTKTHFSKYNKCTFVMSFTNRPTSNDNFPICM